MTRSTAEQFDDPTWTLVRRGEEERKRSEYASAIASFTAAIDSFTQQTPLAARVQSHICRGAAIGQAGNPLAAIGDFSRALALDSNSSLAYYNRAYAKEQLEQYQQAIDDYCRSIELHPADHATYLRRGMCQKRIGDLAGARKDFAHVRRLRKATDKE